MCSLQSQINPHLYLLSSLSCPSGVSFFLLRVKVNLCHSFCVKLEVPFIHSEMGCPPYCSLQDRYGGQNNWRFFFFNFLHLRMSVNTILNSCPGFHLFWSEHYCNCFIQSVFLLICFLPLPLASVFPTKLFPCSFIYFPFPSKQFSFPFQTIPFIHPNISLFPSNLFPCLIRIIFLLPSKHLNWPIQTIPFPIVTFPFSIQSLSPSHFQDFLLIPFSSQILFFY